MADTLGCWVHVTSAVVMRPHAAAKIRYEGQVRT